MKRMPISEARGKLTSLADELRGEALQVTSRGKPVLAVLNWDEYEAIVETLEVLGDPEAMDALRKSVEDVRAGRTVSLDELRQRSEA